jgi:hypothetical protein
MAIVTANVSRQDAQGLVRVDDLPNGDTFELQDQLADQRYRWTRGDLEHGLYVRLTSGDAHLFLVTSA